MLGAAVHEPCITVRVIIVFYIEVILYTLRYLDIGN